MKILYLILLTLILANADAQIKRDYIWHFSRDQESQIIKEQTYLFNFHSNPVSIDTISINYGFDNMNASICDSSGNLLFYTNGCAMINAKDELMPNGDSLNYNEYFEQAFGGICDDGYLGFQDVLILPDPGNLNGYYLITKPRSWEFGAGPSYLQDIWYSYIDMTLNNGLGAVVEKNIIFHSEDRLMGAYLTAIQHSNQKDWWILQPVKQSNKIYTFLIDEFGIQREEDQIVETEFAYNSSSSGTAKFSPDGTKYAMYNYYDQLRVFDFDRSTGQLSNEQHIQVIEPDLDNLWFSSVEWSPNSRFVYTASVTTLHQIDLEAEPIESGIELIGEYDGTQNPFHNVFFLMAQGPDCRIYMCSTSGNRTYHVINKPDEKGAACDFVQNGVDLPLDYTAGFGSMPNHPRWRVDEEEKCDPSIVSMFGVPIITKKELEIFPNPARDEVLLDWGDSMNGELRIYHEEGGLKLKKRIDTSSSQMKLPLDNWTSGVYFVELVPEVSKSKVYVGKLVVVR